MSILTLLPFLPLIGFLLNGLGYPKFSKPLAAGIGLLGPVAAFAIAVWAHQNYAGQAMVLPLLDWIQVGNVSLPLAFQIDALSLMMLLIITGVGSLIHLYSIGYMWHDAGFGKFLAYLNLFVFFMLILVMGSGFVSLFIGWEGVGLCSYLLIGFWNQKNSYGDAARKAFVMNRIGDLGFLLGIFLLFQQFGTGEYQAIFQAIENGQVPENAFLIGLCLFIGAMGKSAQIPLFTWLPDAMAGPTPVSALIHAATMVTAGIYLVLRANVLFELSPEILEFIAWIGIATALLGASIGLFQNDIKKVLAYSTVSQLGYMFLGLGVSAYSASFFHVITHAFFKALLFLGAGSVIHAMSDEQDIRKMGGLRSKLPITYLTFLLGTIAIAGIPPFAGFFSKDEILAHVYHHNLGLWSLAILGSAMTSFYMFRVFMLTFNGPFRGTEHQAAHLHESPWTMTLPLVVLAILSVLGGLVNLPAFVGGNTYLAHFLAPLLPETSELEVHFASLEFLAPLLAAFVPAFLAIYFYSKPTSVPEPDAEIKGIKALVYRKFYIDEAYDLIFVQPVRFLSDFFHQVIEFLFIDLMVEGAGKLVQYASSEFRKLQTGNVGFYLFAMVISIGVILFVTLKQWMF